MEADRIMDKQDLIFFKRRIEELALERIYTRRIFKMINKAINYYEKLDVSYEIQHSLFHGLWTEISKLCEMFFIRDDAFFDTLRAMECEFAGRTYLVRYRLGWLTVSKDAPKYVPDFVKIPM